MKSKDFYPRLNRVSLNVILVDGWNKYGGSKLDISKTKFDL